MKVIFKPSKFDNPSIYYTEIDNEESIILMRSRVWRINQNILKNGGKYKYVDLSFKYIRQKQDE